MTGAAASSVRQHLRHGRGTERGRRRVAGVAIEEPSRHLLERIPGGRRGAQLAQRDLRRDNRCIILKLHLVTVHGTVQTL